MSGYPRRQFLCGREARRAMIQKRSARIAMWWKRKMAAGAAVAVIQYSNVPRYIFLHDRDSCVIVKM